MGLSGRLWALVTRMWLEEYKSSPPTRPNVASVSKHLQGEAEYWDLTIGLLATVKRRAGCLSSTSDLEEFVHEGLIRFLQGIDNPDGTSLASRLYGGGKIH